MATVIEIPYKPYEWQKEVHNSSARWKVLVVHRRAGKTTAALNHLQRDALQIPNSRWAYVAPTYKQAKRIAWDLIKEYSNMIPGIEYNESELTVKYPNGAKLYLLGADAPDSLRGIGLWGVVFDEYSQQPSNVFTEIVRPCLADHGGYAIWIGTPKGKNDFYRLYESATRENWYRVLHTVENTEILTIAELEDAKQQMSDDEFQQEFYCSFIAAIKGAYYAKELEIAYSEGRITKVPYDPALLVHTWWDLGVADSTAIGFFQVLGKEWRLIDYHESSGEGLSYYAKILEDKKYLYGTHTAPHDIEVRELGSGRSRLETAKKLGINFQVAPNQHVIDGIHAVRMRFGSLWIDKDKCSRFLDALSQYQKEWNDKMGEFKPHPLHNWTSHPSDMLRYWAVTQEPKSKKKSAKRKIKRTGIHGI